MTLKEAGLAGEQARKLTPENSRQEIYMSDQLELKSIELKGFKSIDAEGQLIELGPITVMLGANGAGIKSLLSGE